MNEWRHCRFAEAPSVDNPDLFVKCSSFPPHVWELMERVYPNRMVAASRDMGAIVAASRLHGMFKANGQRARQSQKGDEAMNQETVIEACARAAHEVNRAYCIAIGDTSQPPWDEAPDWQKSSALKGVEGVLAGNTPRESHESWLEEKRATGWKYGPTKDPEKKEHPCFVAYDKLPPAQQAKDRLFVDTVRGLAAAFGKLATPA